MLNLEPSVLPLPALFIHISSDPERYILHLLPFRV